MSLANKCSVFAWDARGYGDSIGPPVQTMGDFADDLERVLDSLQLDRVIAVGHSMGGRILMEFVARAPDRVAAMVLSGAQASYLSHMTNADRQTYVSSRKAIFDNGVVPPAKAREVAKQVLPDTVDTAVLDQLVLDFQKLNSAGYLDALAASAGWDRSEVLLGLTMPIAVLGGALDTICPPEECQRIAELIGQGPATILADIGHMPQIEAPKVVTEILRDFINRHGHLASQIDTQTLLAGT